MQNKEELIEKYLKETISRAERRQLEEWVLKHPENIKYFKDSIARHAAESEKVDFNSKMAFDAFLTKVETKKFKTRYSKHLLPYAAVFVGFLLGSYFIFQSVQISNTTENQVVQQQGDEDKNDILITLPDGSKRTLSASGDATVTDANGKIMANTIQGALDFSNSEDPVNTELAFNEVYIPYGEKLKIILSDKTVVWLNAGSTLRFPQNLNATVEQNRMVYLSGEAFFDVTKNTKKPFIVKTEAIDIKVLGTQFNVSAYDQDEEITTTLVEGKVNVCESTIPESAMVLSPDDQASFKKTDSSFEKQKVDTDIYTSWMQNILVINNMSFQQIMTKLERSHNVSIINTVPELNEEIFNGEFKNENIDDILKTISLSKPFNYKINQNKITITR